MTLGEEEAKHSKTNCCWIKTVLGHARSLRWEKQAVGMRTSRRKEVWCHYHGHI